MEGSKIKKALKVIFVDFLGLLIGIINGFLLPNFLSIESYAYIKEFTLLISYSGMLHLGFSDGLYLMLGGKNINEIRKEKIKGYLYALIKILIIVFSILIAISFTVIKNTIFKLFIMYSIPFQITLFVSLLYRATGEFDRYVCIRVLVNILNLVSLIYVVCICKNAYVYMIIQIVGYIIISIIYFLKIIFQPVRAEVISYEEIKKLIKSGFIIMIANTISILFFSLDRWFVKINFSITDFAYYSFGVSMLNLFITLINSITIIFYPCLSKYKENKIIISTIKKYIIIITSFAPVGYFILDIIVRKYIDKYVQSLSVLGILIMCIPFITIVNVLYANMYKVLNQGKKYLITAIKMIIVSIILNISVLFTFNNSISIAYATLVSLVIWYLYSSMHFKVIKIEKNELIHFIVYFLTYDVVKELNLNSIYKGLIFTSMMIISLYIHYKKDLFKLISILLNKEKIDII